jgi:hypothetical protein
LKALVHLQWIFSPVAGLVSVVATHFPGDVLYPKDTVWTMIMKVGMIIITGQEEFSEFLAILPASAGCRAGPGHV